MTHNNSIEDNNTYSSYGIGLSFYDEKITYEEKALIKILLSVFLATAMVISLIGNICICAVIARDKNMRTPTNFYLLNLAITDLTITVFVPVEIYIIWVPDFYPLGKEGCRIHFLLWDMGSNCSVLTITAITIERYLVISKPFLRQRLVLNSRVLKIVTIIWMVSCFFAFPSVLFVYFVERKQNVYCFFTVSDKDKAYLVAAELLVFFVLPMTVIFVLYLMMVLKLKSTKSKSRPNPVSGKKNRDKAVKMLAAVAASFFICWSPYSILRLMIVIPNMKYENHHTLWRVLIYLSSINSYLSTAVNPILYTLMSQKFGQAFKDLLKGRNISNQTNAKANGRHKYRRDCLKINTTSI
ncbi:neuromedin-U receptor 2-like isoform X2 [Nymphalis io]|uniref:neuromedin-U receptor 2-like isoform X2 n=1 Tax=Inachis io TaxID=171585 RepID=UPI00216A2F24|nr:neuromedin-U receptor 2-like isoform X2 [Nymphalis io]